MEGEAGGGRFRCDHPNVIIGLSMAFQTAKSNVAFLRVLDTAAPTLTQKAHEGRSLLSFWEWLKAKRNEKWGKGKGTCDSLYIITFLMCGVFNGSWVKAIGPGQSIFHKFGIWCHFAWASELEQILSSSLLEDTYRHTYTYYICIYRYIIDTHYICICIHTL